jgi:hypothetical protein
MSTWTDIRDSLLVSLDAEGVGNSLKADFVKWLNADGVDFLQKVADKISNECKSDADNESGWCKIRDGVVLPMLLNIGMYIIKLVISKAKAE